jgi:DNA-binding HxlR family transcriptional regulator
VPDEYDESMTERERAEVQPPSSPLAHALVQVGDRWSLLVVEALLVAPGRFSELLDEISGIAPNILSDRLKRLERDGLVLSRPYSDRPPRARYELTGEGKELAGALRQLAHWAARHVPSTETPRHSACGTPLEVKWYCPTCDRLVDEQHEAEVQFL